MSEPSLHYAKFDADTDTLTFTCYGDEKAECHIYPDCQCEIWFRDEPCHPFVPHSECWMQGFFDNDVAGFTGPDEDRDDSGDFAKPRTSYSGPVTVEFEEEYVAWDWADGGPPAIEEWIPGQRIGGGQPADSPTLFEATA